MKCFKILFGLLIFLNGLSACSVAPNDFTVNMYIGTFTNNDAKGLYICSFDTISGVIADIRLAKEMGSPNFLTLSKNKEYMYVCVRPGKGKDDKSAVEAYGVNKETGELTFINREPTTGSDPCYVDISDDGKLVVTANYSGGNLTVFNANNDGSLTSSTQLINHKGSGIVNGRQEKPHAHSVRFSPFNNWVFAADLGIDKLMIYELDSKQKKLFAANQPYVELEPGAGPRHFDFHPNGKNIYVVNELNSTVSVLAEENSNYEVVQVISTLPEGYSDDSYCADIHVSPDARFLYCSNRGHNSIAYFSIEEEGRLSFIGTTSTQGDWPRNFTFDPTGKFMLVANQKSNNIAVYKLDRESGEPVFSKINVSVPSPVCLVFL